MLGKVVTTNIKEVKQLPLSDLASIAIDSGFSWNKSPETMNNSAAIEAKLCLEMRLKP